MGNKQETSIYEGLGEALFILADLKLLINRLRKDENNEIINGRTNQRD